MHKTVFKKIWDGLKFAFKSFFIFLDKIKFVFLIPVLSLASTIFALVIIVLIQPIITQLPGFLSEGFVQTAIGGIIFIILSLMIFKDRLSKNLTYDVKSYLIAFGGAILFWIIPVIFLKRQGNFLGAFYTSEYLDFLSIFDSISTFIYLALISPHFWLATITKEYVISVAFGLVLNGAFIIFLALRIVYDLGPDSKNKPIKSNN